MNVNTEDIRNQLAGNKSGTAELRSRLLFVMFALLVYRVGTHIPVPGIDPAQLQALFNQNQGGILELFNMFSGGAWERMSNFSSARVSLLLPLHKRWIHHRQQIHYDARSDIRNHTKSQDTHSFPCSS